MLSRHGMTRGVVSALLVGGALAAGSAAVSAQQLTAADSPYSGAALNVLQRQQAAKRGAIRPIYGQRKISTGTVNNPGTDTTAQDTQSETTVIDLGSGDLVASFNDSGSETSGAHFTGYAFSTNNGKTWTDGGILPASAGGDAGDPVLAFNQSNGMVYMATLEFNALANIQVFRSTDRGHTFLAPVNGTPGVAGQQDKNWLAVDNFGGAGNGNVYLCWTQFNPGGNIRLTRSTDGGATFGPSGGVLLSSGGQGCFVAVSPNHQVNVFYYRGTGAGGQGGDNRLFLRRSNDQGVTFGPEVQVADLNTTTVNGNLSLKGGLRSNSFPHAAINPLDGTMVAVFNDDPSLADTTDNGNVYYAVSGDGGSTWSTKTTITTGAAENDQFFPTVAFANNSSNLMFAFYARNQDPENLMFHRRAALGTAAGGVVTVRRGFQLGPNTPVVIGQDPAINTTYMGDYDQIAPGNGFLSTTWSDNRNGNSFHARQPDVRFARIKVPSPSSDLSLQATAFPSTIQLGADTTITVDVWSTGGPANDAFVNLGPTPGLFIRSVTPSSGRCDLINGIAGCSLGTIKSGQVRTVQVVATAVYGAGTRTFRSSGTTSSTEPAINNNVSNTKVIVQSGGTVTKTYSTGSVAVNLPGNSLTDVPLNIGDFGEAVQIIPRFRINHTWDADLRIFLISPLGKTVELTTANGGSGDDYGSGATNCSGTMTQFDDLAATPITAGAPPFAGVFKPEGLIGAVLGDEINGQWRLRVFEDFAADSGTLFCFQMQVTRVP